MSDDYEPALTETATNEPGAESTITTRTAEQKAEPNLAAGETGDDPEKPPGSQPRGARQLSDKTRAMMRNLAASASKAEAAEAGAVAGVADDLVPMGEDDSPPAAAAAGASPPSASPAAAAAVSDAEPGPVAALNLAAELATYVPVPIPAPQPVVAPAVAAPDPREKLLADREALIAEREKLLPDLNALIEKPGATLINWLKTVYNVTDEAELEQIIADTTAELSESGLKTKLPAEFKSALEARKASRSVRAIRAEMSKREAAIAEKQAAIDKASAAARESTAAAQYEANAQSKIQEMIAPTRATAAYLHNPDLTDGVPAHVIVWDVVKEQDKIARKWLADNPGYQLPEKLKPSVERAVAAGNEYYKKQADALVKRAASLQPKTATIPAKPAATATASPGAAPGPAAKQAPLPVARVVSDETMTDDEQRLDRRDRRAADAKALFAKHFKNKPQPNQ